MLSLLGCGRRLPLIHSVDFVTPARTCVTPPFNDIDRTFGSGWPHAGFRGEVKHQSHAFLHWISWWRRDRPHGTVDLAPVLCIF